MTPDEIEAEIGLLMTRMQNEPEDIQEFALQLIQRMNELEAYGMPLPDDLIELRATLQEQLAQDTTPPPAPAA